MKNKTKISMLAWMVSFNAIAGTYLPTITLNDNSSNRWSVMASLGYGQYEHVYPDDKQTALGRLALGAELLSTTQTAFGLEMGVQNGKHLRVDLQESPQTDINGLIRTTIKPMLDFLVTANIAPLTESLLFAQLKGGLAYHQWNINTPFINNKNELSGEIQAGVGYPLTELANLNVLYQGVFGGNPSFHASPNELGYFSSMPVVHGVLLGVSILA